MHKNEHISYTIICEDNNFLAQDADAASMAAAATGSFDGETGITLAISASTSAMVGEARRYNCTSCKLHETMLMNKRIDQIFAISTIQLYKLQVTRNTINANPALQ